MAIHTVRDYISQNTASGNRQWIPGYLLSIFMRRLLDYSYVGDTNYPINAVGTLLIATADSTPTATTPTFAAGTKAGINQGVSREFYVWVPPATRTVQLADVGRLLVLKSTTNSTFNSGIYLITGYEALNLSISTTSGTAVSPITITTTAPNTLTTGQTVTISGVTGNTNANGTWTVTVLNNTQFTISATGNANYISGGTVVTNCYIIDYRTMGSFPPQEAFGSMNWYLYAADSAAPASGNTNSTWPTTYGGNGNSTTARIILQSPHSLGWQTRICHETTFDWGRNIGQTNGACASVPLMTASPGFGGNSAGDFTVSGPHLHTALFYSGTYDANAYGANSYMSGNCPGFGEPAAWAIAYSPSQYSGIPYRTTLVGDDTGQGIVMICRRQFNGTTPKSFLLTFGLPENEPLPLPVNNVARLFCIGSGISGSNNGDFGNTLNDISLSTGAVFGASFGNSFTENNTVQGVSQSPGGIPCSCAPALWSYTQGATDFGSPGFDPSSGDSPWANGTELFPVDLINGTETSWNGSTNPQQPPIFLYEPRIIGTIPHLRAGRSSHGEYTATNDANRAWQHMRRGIYITWNGPQVVP
jgi:hypothetical protein